MWKQHKFLIVGVTIPCFIGILALYFPEIGKYLDHSMKNFNYDAEIVFTLHQIEMFCVIICQLGIALYLSKVLYDEQDKYYGIEIL